MIDRNTYIGSTEIVALVEPEASPFTSAYAMFCEKTGLVEREDNPTERMKTGKYLERAILDEWNTRNTRAFAFNTEPIFYADGIGATPDGIDVFANEGAEVKTVSSFARDHWENGTPRYIWWQNQHHMLCAGLSRMVSIAQFGFDSLAHEWIEADVDAHRRIIEACGVFWAQCRGELPPPEADGHDATTNVLKRRKLDAKVIELGAEVRDWSEELKLSEAVAKHHNEVAQTLKNKIRAAMGDANTGVWPDGSGWRIQTVNRKEFVVKASTYTAMKRIKSRDAEDGQDE